MNAPSRHDNPFIEKVVGSETDAAEMKSYGHPTERIIHVSDPVLRKEMTQTTAKLAKKHPELLPLVKHSESLEENFFRLMDTMHFMANMVGKDQFAQGQTEQEKLHWECQNLIQMADANKLTLPQLWSRITFDLISDRLAKQNVADALKIMFPNKQL